MTALKWKTHADLAIRKTPSVGRNEYLDHRIPNGTPLENYRFYIQKAWEIMNRESTT